MNSSSEISGPIAAMRRESLLRTALVLLIAFVIPSLSLASTYTYHLADLVIRFGGPITHILHAMALFIVMTICTVFIVYFLDRRYVQRYSRKAPLSPGIDEIYDEFAARFSVRPEIRIVGGVRSAEMTSLVSGCRPIILMPASRLLESKKNPAAFRFRLAHEFAHLAANDYRSDVWANSAYVVGTIFLVSALGYVLWNVFERLIFGTSFGLSYVWFTLRGAALPLTTNLAAFGSLVGLLFLEHRAAIRLREFHADAVATSVSGASAGAFVGMLTIRSSSLISWVIGLVNVHPHAGTRTTALTERQAAFRTDLITIVIQGFFAATVVEMALQLLLVGASSDISSLAERQAHLQAQFARYPEVIWGIIGVTAAVSAVANFLVIQRLKMLEAPNGNSFAAMQIALLYALGATLALLSSQTFLWEISVASWNIGVWIAQDPERPLIHVAGILGFVLTAGFARILSRLGASPLLTALGVCWLPPLLQLSAVLWLLLPP